MSIQTTLGNEKWLSENFEKLKAILPQTWTHVANLNGLQIGFKLKLLGVDWRFQDEFGKVMVFLERIKLMQRDGVQIRANPHFTMD